MKFQLFEKQDDIIGTKELTLGQKSRQAFENTGSRKLEIDTFEMKNKIYELSSTGVLKCLATVLIKKNYLLSCI